MWKNSLKNIKSDNNKILYENLLELFYSETVLTFRISLVLRALTYCCSWWDTEALLNLYYLLKCTTTVQHRKEENNSNFPSISRVHDPEISLTHTNDFLN
jgi:hypothetical protein